MNSPVNSDLRFPITTNARLVMCIKLMFYLALSNMQFVRSYPYSLVALIALTFSFTMVPLKPLVSFNFESIILNLVFFVEQGI